MTEESTIEVNLYVDVEKENDKQQTARLIQERLGQLEMVKEVEAVPKAERFTGVEVVAAIGVTVLIVRGSRELIEELRKLIPQLKGLITEIKGLKDVFVEVGDKRIPIAEIKDETLQQLEATVKP